MAYKDVTHVRINITFHNSFQPSTVLILYLGVRTLISAFQHYLHAVTQPVTNVCKPSIKSWNVTTVGADFIAAFGWSAVVLAHALLHSPCKAFVSTPPSSIHDLDLPFWDCSSPMILFADDA
ncbi:hypothetical protein KP509_1Z037400 [Ceratopteris richardii]|nr:hypothetical protein KP509_1Z037400 [Ceratopteris richardii]